MVNIEEFYISWLFYEVLLIFIIHVHESDFTDKSHICIECSFKLSYINIKMLEQLNSNEHILGLMIIATPIGDTG